jgi:hypothetical protein
MGESAEDDAETVDLNLEVECVRRHLFTREASY